MALGGDAEGAGKNPAQGEGGWNWSSSLQNGIILSRWEGARRSDAHSHLNC
jgi:hypothetical protein